jgi:hypothetical protein
MQYTNHLQYNEAILLMIKSIKDITKEYLK